MIAHGRSEAIIPQRAGRSAEELLMIAHGRSEAIIPQRAARRNS